METKYYTPTIEEFHVGLECEVLYDGNYEKCKIQIGILDQNLVGRLNKPNKLIDVVLTDKSIVNFRAKYLCHEDIENLGWIQRDYDTFDFGNNIAFEFIPEDTSYIYTYGGGKNSYTIFQGKIKNESELKKLMQQLNIE